MVVSPNKRLMLERVFLLTSIPLFAYHLFTMDYLYKLWVSCVNFVFHSNIRKSADHDTVRSLRSSSNLGRHFFNTVTGNAKSDLRVNIPPTRGLVSSEFFSSKFVARSHELCIWDISYWEILLFWYQNQQMVTTVQICG